MDNVNVRNAQGELITINIVRFFRLNEKEYLLFSLNETDDGGYVKLYICKVVGNNATTVTDDVEWNLIKDTIKNIIKLNKDNLPLPIVDIDAGKLNNIQITDQKVFKLSEAFINLLGANKKVEPTIETPVTPQFEAGTINIQDGNSVQSQLVQEVTPIEPVPVVESQLVQENIPSGLASAAESDITGLSIDQQNINQIPESDLSDGIKDYALDYKTLYENELNKNNDLVEQNQKYKSIINNLRKIIEEAL